MIQAANLRRRRSPSPQLWRFITDATRLAAEFIRHWMPSDFLKDLGEARTAFEHAITGHAEVRQVFRVPKSVRLQAAT
jgi:hypothetical protein